MRRKLFDEGTTRRDVLQPDAHDDRADRRTYRSASSTVPMSIIPVTSMVRELTRAPAWRTVPGRDRLGQINVVLAIDRSPALARGLHRKPCTWEPCT